MFYLLINKTSCQLLFLKVCSIFISAAGPGLSSGGSKPVLPQESRGVSRTAGIRYSSSTMPSPVRPARNISAERNPRQVPHSPRVFPQCEREAPLLSNEMKDKIIWCSIWCFEIKDIGV